MIYLMVCALLSIFASDILECRYDVAIVSEIYLGNNTYTIMWIFKYYDAKKQKKKKRTCPKRTSKQNVINFLCL